MDTIKGLIGEGVYQEIKIDAHTSALLVIQSGHNQVHLGNHYFFRTWIQMNRFSGPVYLAFHTAPYPTLTHAYARVRAESEITAEIFYEATVDENSGQMLFGTNNNMNLDKQHEMIILSGPTVIDEGQSFWRAKVDNDNPASVTEEDNYSIIPHVDSCYLWKISKEGFFTAPWIDVSFWWWEQAIPKDIPFPIPAILPPLP